MSSSPDRPTSVPSLEALQKDVALANRRAVRRTAKIISVVLLLALLVVGGFVFFMTRDLEEQFAKYPVDRSQEDRFVSRGGYLFDRGSGKPLARLTNEVVAIATISADGHIALVTEGRLTVFWVLERLIWGRDRVSDSIIVFDLVSSAGRIVFNRSSSTELSFSPDSTKILAISKAGSATIWTLQGERFGMIETEGPVRYAAFFPNGNNVLVVPDKGAATVQSLQGQLVATISDGEAIFVCRLLPRR